MGRGPARCCVAALALCGLAAGAVRAETPLYETGPGQDAAFVRFLNASDVPVTVVAAKGEARIELPPRHETRVSRFHPVVAGKAQRATVSAMGRSLGVEVRAKPGEYVTVAVIVGGQGPRVGLLRELPDDYTAARSSIALLNADPACRRASMSGGAAAVGIVEGVQPLAIARRLVNPVRLLAQVACDGKPAGAPVDLAQLQPGERYSVFLIATPTGRATFFVVDRVL